MRITAGCTRSCLKSIAIRVCRGISLKSLFQPNRPFWCLRRPRPVQEETGPHADEASESSVFFSPWEHNTHRFSQGHTMSIRMYIHDTRLGRDTTHTELPVSVQTYIRLLPDGHVSAQTRSYMWKIYVYACIALLSFSLPLHADTSVQVSTGCGVKNGRESRSLGVPARRTAEAERSEDWRS